MNRLSLCALTLVLITSSMALAGDLTPPGTPASTMVALDELESRTPISSLPRTISSSGSYYIAGDLTGSSGITVSANDVTIDLMGHSLIGTGGSTDGIGTSSTLRNVTILNGTVSNWGADGIGLDTVSSVRVINVTAKDNGDEGIAVADESLVINCMADANSGNGIEAGLGSMVIDCIASDNIAHGINVGDRCIVRGCSVPQNHSDGVEAASSVLIVDNVCNFDSDDGIRALDNCIIRGNTCQNNGSGSTTNNAGIYLEGNRNRADGNDVSENDEYGFQIDGDENLITRNTAWSNGSISADNYRINGVNTQISTTTSPSSTNPWANFTFDF